MQQPMSVADHSTSTENAGRFEVVGHSSGILQSIQFPETNLALWYREEQPDISHEIERLEAYSLADEKHESSFVSFESDLTRVFTSQGLDPKAFDNLRADAQQLMSLFQRISQPHELRFRLVTTDQDDCRRFHLDRVNMRLITTYQGPGTEYLKEHELDRLAERNGGTNEDIMKLGTSSHFPTHAVGIMKGDPRNHGKGLVHRSPAISATGIVRVLFCLDC